RLQLAADRIAVARLQRVVGGLDTQLTHALEHRVDFVQRAFSGLDERDTVLGIPLSLAETLDLRPHLLRDAQASSVVASAVDAQAARQLLDALRVRGRREAEITLRVEGLDVRVDSHTH